MISLLQVALGVPGRVRVKRTLPVGHTSPARQNSPLASAPPPLSVAIGLNEVNSVEASLEASSDGAEKTICAVNGRVASLAMLLPPPLPPCLREWPS